MIYMDTMDQIRMLVTACASLLIISVCILPDSEKTESGQFGFAFFTPFLFSAASFISGKEWQQNGLLDLSAVLLPYAVLFVLLSGSGPVKRNDTAVKSFLVCLPLLIMTAALKAGMPGDDLLHSTAVFPAAAAITLDLYLVMKRGKKYRMLLWGLAAVLAGYVMNAAHLDGSMPALYISALAGGYLLFFTYFYGDLRKRQQLYAKTVEKQVEEARRLIHAETRYKMMEMERSHRKLVDLARTDSLTKALNKAAIISEIENLVNLPSRDIFSIMLLDIDDFKSINDNYGHIKGDVCIRKLAVIARSCIRDVDNFGRYGGDEFLIVLPQVDASRAKLIAERSRKKVEETQSPHFTISIGMATYPYDAMTVNGLMAYADEGLYISKRRGKNVISHKDSQKDTVALAVSH